MGKTAPSGPEAVKVLSSLLRLTETGVSVRLRRRPGQLLTKGKAG
jgi:hypothetical protein